MENKIKGINFAEKQKSFSARGLCDTRKSFYRFFWASNFLSFVAAVWREKLHSMKSQRSHDGK